VAKFLTPILVVTVLALVGAVTLGFVVQADVTVRAPGEIRPYKYAELRPTVEGRAVEVFKIDGDVVKKGEAILRIDSDDERLALDKVRCELQRLDNELKDRARKGQEFSKKIELAEAGLHVAEAQVKEQETRAAQCKLDLEHALATPEDHEIRMAEERLKQQELAEHDAQKNYDDAQMLHEKGMLAELGVEKSFTALKTAQSELRVRHDALELLKKRVVGVGVEKARAELDSRNAALLSANAHLEERQRELDLARLAQKDQNESRRLETDTAKAKLEEQRLLLAIDGKTLRASLDGFLYDFHVKAGQTVTHKERCGWIYDTTKFLFYARAKQVDLAYIEPGQTTRLYIDALPYRTEGTFDAEVLEAARVAEVGEAHAGDDPGPKGMVFLLVTESGEKGEKLRVGFTGQAEILIGRASLIGILFGSRKKR